MVRKLRRRFRSVFLNASEKYRNIASSFPLGYLRNRVRQRYAPEAASVSDKPGKTGYELVFSFVPEEEQNHWSEADREFMQRALELAGRAGVMEVPVGALVVHQSAIVGEGWNRPISSADP